MATIGSIATSGDRGDGMPGGQEADEAQLLAALRRGRAGAGGAAEALVEATYRRTWRALFRLTGGDGELASDLTQEAYRKAWAALGRFEGRARFSTWLFRIAYTTYLHHVRRPHRLVPLEGPGGGDEAPWEARLPDPGPLPDEELAASRSGASLRRAVLALPDALRFTVTAHYWGELPVREIARQEGVTTVAIRKRLKKALGLLAARLEEEF